MDKQTGRLSLLLVALLPALLSSCGVADAPAASPADDDEEEQQEEALINYKRDVQPIWDAHCTSCHGDTPTAQAGLILRAGESFAALMTSTQNPCIAEDGGLLELPRVAPGDPAASMLWVKLNTDLTAPTWPQCGREMPVVGTALATTHPEAAETVRLWIVQGAQAPQEGDEPSAD